MSELSERDPQLARSLRSAAVRAAEVVDGVALIFANGGAGPRDLRLRSAAGFRLAEDARRCGSTLAPLVREAASGNAPRDLPHEARGAAAACAGGVRIYPLRSEDREHGVLAVASPQAPAPDQDARLAEILETISMCFERARVAQECAELRQQLEERGDSGPEKNEEMLRLSEALFAQDIELLRSNEKLGKVERLKNDFIEKMSRELRTPLNSIIEAIISVLTGEDDALSEAAKGALRGALDEGSAFLRTLGSILDLWRIKQGELPVETQDVNFAELVDEAIFSVQDTIGSKAIRIETELEQPFPRLRTDLAKLNQILFLLLDNAVKFTPEGLIQITARVHRGRLHVSIEDQGIGICHDDQQYIFDEFYQVDEPSSQKYRGAGLGLTLVRDLIVLLEGEIAVNSDIGHGTTVEFSLPIQTRS